MRALTIYDFEELVRRDYTLIGIVGPDLLVTTDLHCDECCPPKVRLSEAHKEEDRSEKFANHFESVFSLEGSKFKLAPHIEPFNKRGWRMDDGYRVRSLGAVGGCRGE